MNAFKPVRWKPNVTVAAVVEHEGRYLLVEEHTAAGLRLNNPAGHLEPGESPHDAVVREVLEETTCRFTPEAVVGVFLGRSASAARDDNDTTYLRLAFCGRVGAPDPQRRLDDGIVRTLWLTIDEVRAQRHRHRSAMVMACIEAHREGVRYPLTLISSDLQGPDPGP